MIDKKAVKGFLGSKVSANMAKQLVEVDILLMVICRRDNCSWPLKPVVGNLGTNPT